MKITIPMKILRLPEVMEQTGLARSTIYRKMGEGSFPCGVKLGARATGWRESELVQWSEGLTTYNQQVKS
jgi:prophage regulatory protein